MATITLKGNPIHTIGDLPQVGATVKDFRLTKQDLSDVSLSDFAGKKKVFNIVPSLDTGVCAASAKRFDKEIGALEGAVCLTISADLPFAQGRFCSSESISNVITLSQMRDKAFGKDYGVEIIDGPMAGVLSRAVIVTDANNRVVYTEQVPEIVQEPDYGAALKAVREA